MTEDVGEFHFCMEKALMDQVGSVFIDCDPTGSFRIYTERPLSIRFASLRRGYVSQHAAR